MFYVGNIDQWIAEINDTCREHHISLKDSIFILMLFSSLDSKYVKFFKTKKQQISSFSGKNVHIFTPVIYEEDTIPDSEVRSLRNEFIKEGISIDSEPTAIFFTLKESSCGENEYSHMPAIFSAYKLPQKEKIEQTTKNIVETCISHRDDIAKLTNSLSKALQAKNIAALNTFASLPKELGKAFTQPYIFLSHSSIDKPIVRCFCSSLRSYGFQPWLDESEIQPGDNIKNSVEQALKKSDLLLVFLSKASSTAPWVHHELSFFSALPDANRIVPIALDEEGKKLASSLPATFGRLYLDASTPEGVKNAVERIRALVERH